MRKLLFLAFLITLVLVSGCTQPSELGATTSTTLAQDSAAICGNGIVEFGETSENCCLDVPCPDFYSCKELTQGDKTINTCAKTKLEDTKEYKNFLGYLDEETMEYEKEYDLIDYDYILTKIEQMDRTISKLENAYDVSIEKTYVQYRYDRREWNIKRGELVENSDKETDEDKQKIIFQRIINLDKQELKRLEGFLQEDADKINSKFDYDILERISFLKSTIEKEEKFLETWEKGYQIELSIIDYNPSCYTYSNECFIDYVKLKIKNTGELPLTDPTFDFYIYKGEQVVSRDIDTYSYDLTEIPSGYDGIYKETYIGYDNKESIQEGSYTLKVNLKQGISTKVIATASTTINLR